VATNAMPLDKLTVGVEGDPASVAPASLEALAAVTHEELPRPREVGPSAAEGAIFGVLAVATLGIVRIEPSSTHTEYPSDEEIRRAAPRAYAFAQRLRSSCSQPVSEGVAVRCTYAFVVRRDARTPVSLSLSFRLESRPSRRDTCVSTETARLSLGMPDALAEGVARTYPGFRRVDDVASPSWR
jgi:hypothetical protein